MIRQEVLEEAGRGGAVLDRRRRRRRVIARKFLSWDDNDDRCQGAGSVWALAERKGVRLALNG
jgi:hypothetical protein